MTRIIGGAGRGRRLKAPRGSDTRPTADRVKQTLFDILAPEVPGSRFLDLCAGSGGIGLEARSRGAHRVTLVERARSAAEVIRENVAVLGGGGVDVITLDVNAALDRLAATGQAFDIVYLDPPYESDLYETVLARLDARDLLAPDGVAVAEHFHKRTLPETIGRLACTRTVRVGDHVLAFYRMRTDTEGGP